MKTLTLSLLATFCCLFSFAQDLNSTTVPQSFARNSQVFLSADRAELASIENTQFQNSFYREKAADRCKHARKMRTTGIVLSCIGGGLLAGGATMIAVGVSTIANNGDPILGVGLTYGGAIVTIFGVAGVGAGIPIAIIGAVHARKYCGQAKESSYMRLSTKGNSLALSF